MTTTTIPNKMHPTNSRANGLPNNVMTSTTSTLSTSNSTGSIDSSSSATNNIPTPTNSNMAERLAQIDDLKYFLATAAEHWEENDAENNNNNDDDTTMENTNVRNHLQGGGMITTTNNIKRFRLPTGEDMSCVLWNELFYITGTDIVRSLTFRFHAFGRPVTNAKKFEEGIFSDLRNLKPGNDARLEEPKSELLDMLYKNNCIRTQKKQKVFYWYSVPHDRLFLDALERDLKREKMDMEPTTVAVAEPASSLSLDSTQELFDQLRKSMSLSAAATAHALEDEAARCTVSHAQQQGYWGWLPHQRNRSAVTSSTVNSPATSSVVPSNKQQSMANTTAPMRRSRVNSVPTTTASMTTAVAPPNGTICARHHYHHLSHAGRPSPKAPIRPRVRSRATTPSSPAVARQRLTSTFEGRQAYTNRNKPTTTMAGTTSSTNKLVSPQQPMGRTPGRSDTPSPVMNPAVTGMRRPSSDAPKSLDSTTLKKKKAIFGALSLFDGSPTYKQRRRRAASTSTTVSPHGNTTMMAPMVSTQSTAIASTPTHHSATAMTTGSPYALMHPPLPSQHHEHHPMHMDAGSSDMTGVVASQQRPTHLIHQSSAPSSLMQYDASNNNHDGHSSRLAMAAASVGYVQSSIVTPAAVPIPSPSTTICHQQQQQQQQRQEPTPTWSSAVVTTKGKLMEPERTYTCPQASCGHMFKLLEHLDQHLRAHELEQPFMCPLCGKRFTHSEFLMEHRQTHHDMLDGTTVKGSDCACSSASSSTAEAAASPLSWQHLPAETNMVAAAAAMCTTPTATLTPPSSVSCQYNTGKSNDTSRSSTLSPMLDLDNFYETTAMTTATTSMPGGSGEFPFRSRTSSSSEDDSASSLTSSPASAIHLNQQPQQHYFPHHHQPQWIDDVSDTLTPFMFNATDSSFGQPPVTLFSSFKPELFQQQQQQQQLQLQQQPHHQQQFYSTSPNHVGPFQYDDGFQQDHSIYTPFVVPADVSMTMM